MKVQNYSIDEIFEKKLYFLIPFYIFTYEKELRECNRKVEKLQELVQVYENILERLKQVTGQGMINELMKRTIMDMSQKVIQHLSRRYEKVKERLGAIMGGQILEYEAKDIYRSGLADGMERGRVNGIEANKIDLITRKLKKEKTIAQIADELEETEETVRKLIEAHNLMEKR